MSRLNHRNRNDDPKQRLARHISLGGALIGVGALALYQGGIVRADWPLLIAALLAWAGVVRIVVVRDAWALIHGMAFIAAAGYVWAVSQHLVAWSLREGWPWLVIAGGALMLAQGFVHRGERDQGGERDLGDQRGPGEMSKGEPS